MTDERPSFQIRRRQSRRRRARQTLIAVLIVLVAAGLVWLVGFSSVLGVNRVQVTGVTIVSADQVTAAAQVVSGTPLARVNSRALAGRVTDAIPEVASVTVSRHWPNTLVIHVTERVVVYQVLMGGTYQWVDATGTVFHSSDDPQSVPQATLDLTDQQLVADVATVVTALPADLLPHVSSITAATLDSITLSLDDDRQINWGSADQSDLKAQVIDPLLNVPGTVYDVSAPANPAVH